MFQTDTQDNDLCDCDQRCPKCGKKKLYPSYPYAYYPYPYYPSNPSYPQWTVTCSEIECK